MTENGAKFLKNIRKIFEENSQCSYKLQLINKKVYFISQDKIFSDITLVKIINFVNTVHKTYKSIKIPIVFYFAYNKVEFKDKLTCVLFECICYSLIKDFNHKIYLHLKIQTNTHKKGLLHSPIHLLSEGKKTEDFIKNFEIRIFKSHFRKLIKGGELKEDTNFLGNLFGDINTYLKPFSITEECRHAVSEMITELVGNACEHCKTDCLLDIDIPSDIFELQNSRSEEIHIVIINFSDKLLGDGIKEKIMKNNLGTDRYLKLSEAYNYHKENFSSFYSFIDFCILSTFQDKISGRPGYNLAGGAGLTKLIKSLQEKTYQDISYVQSGNRMILFLQELLEYDEDTWIGFNEKNNFFKSLPSSKIFNTCKLFLPGTAYNLNILIEREVENDNNNIRLSQE